MTVADPAPPSDSASPPAPAADPPSTSSAARPWPALEWALLLLFAVGGAAIGLRPVSDNSFFTHLATGRLILADGVPSADPYSFTALGEPWTVQSWAASGYWALAERMGGMLGVRVATALLTAILGGLVWTLTIRCRSLLPRLGVAAVAVAVGSYMWSGRPLLFGLVFLGLTLLALDDRLRGPWLVPVFWAWTHTHGSFPLGLVAIGAFGLGRALDERALPRRELELAGWAVLGSAAGVLGPDGVDRLTFPVRLLSATDHLRLLLEWSRPSLSDAWTRAFVVQVVLAVAVVARSWSWRAAVPAVVFLGLSVSAQRNISAASLVLLPVIAPAVPAVGRMTVASMSRAARPVAAIAVALFAVVAVSQVRKPDLDLSTYPVDALAFVAPLAEDGGLVLTDETTGNLLTLVAGGRWPVSIDDRLDMYPEDVVDDYLVVLRAEDGWEAVLDDWGVEAVVWETGRPVADDLATSPAWRVVYDDGTWMVACRRDAERCADLTS